MDLAFTDAEFDTLHEPLECCGGEKAIAACRHPVDGLSLHVVVVQHELWCSMAPPGVEDGPS